LEKVQEPGNVRLSVSRVLDQSIQLAVLPAVELPGGLPAFGSVVMGMGRLGRSCTEPWMRRMVRRGSGIGVGRGAWLGTGMRGSGESRMPTRMPTRISIRISNRISAGLHSRSHSRIHSRKGTREGSSRIRSRMRSRIRSWLHGRVYSRLPGDVWLSLSCPRLACGLA